MSNAEAPRVAASGCELGEGPVWLPEARALLFTDIIGRRLLRWSEADGLQRIEIGARVGCFAPMDRAGRRILAAVEQGLEEIALDFAAGRAERAPVAAAPSVSEAEIMNDGKTDPAGRFVFGSKALSEADPIASLMAFDGAAGKTLLRDVTIWNGPAFSPAGDRIYFADSPTRKIFSAPYDVASCALGEVSVFAELVGDEGYPDGMAADAEGGLWNAHWDGGRLTRYLPDGTVDRVVGTPARRPTSIAFGGPEMRTLFVTSAKRGRDDAEPLTDAGAGDLYAVEVDIPGAPIPALKLG